MPSGGGLAFRGALPAEQPARYDAARNVNVQRYFKLYYAIARYISSACESADQYSDFVPCFAGYDYLAVLDLVRFQVQSLRSSIRSYHESGHAGWSFDAPGYTANRLGHNSRAVQFLPNVTNNLKLASFE